MTDRMFAKKLAKLSGMLKECATLSEELLSTDQAQTIEQIAEDEKRFTVLKNMYTAYKRGGIHGCSLQAEELSAIGGLIEILTNKTERQRELCRKEHVLPKIENYGFSKTHNKKSEDIYRFISEVDSANGDAFCFKCGGDGDNGELLMDLLDKYFDQH